jgi:hypothetical protein
MPIRLPSFIPFALRAVSVLASASLAVKPAADKPVAVLFPPRRSAARVIATAAAADGAIVRFGGVPTILVLAAGGPDLADRLRHAGHGSYSTPGSWTAVPRNHEKSFA